MQGVPSQRHDYVALAADIVVVIVLFVGFLLICGVLSWALPPSELARRLFTRAKDWSMLATVVLLAVRIFSFVIVRAYSHGRVRARSWTDTRGLFSAAAGLAALAVVFALMDRAYTTPDSTSKFLVYLSAFILGIEVAFMASFRSGEVVPSASASAS